MSLEAYLMAFSPDMDPSDPPEWNVVCGQCRRTGGQRTEVPFEEYLSNLPNEVGNGSSYLVLSGGARSSIAPLTPLLTGRRVAACASEEAGRHRHPCPCQGHRPPQ
eukprot:TRINITY_DN357_c0_g1_i13.p1 TRINITY_DN357_c0_g1~~TRINITY_DN357_c0_g1_i13.p1  ORF type:complete len:106 (-),score=5.98 TRINITY_DN357_c0_g1_i13:140-457(-)